MANYFGVSKPMFVTGTTPVPSIDFPYGIYNSVSEALQKLKPEQRSLGLTAGILINNELVEYWFSAGITDAHFIPKVKNGEDGKDGNGVEFVFIRTNSSVHPATPPSQQVDDFVPPGWTNDPIGPTEALRWEWSSVRRRTNGVWSSFSTPSLWAHLPESGQPGSSGTFVIFLYKLSVGQPTTPTFTKIAESYTDGWTATAPQAGNGMYVWMSHATAKDSNIISPFSPPTRITGEDGEDGIDGNTIEFIYRVTPTGDRPATPATSQEDDYIPAGWTDDPSGVTETNQYEWVSQRTKVGGVWSAYSQPALWAKWGAEGRDGAGFEYIFTRTANKDVVPATPATSQVDGYVPPGWTNNPSGVNVDLMAEFCSTRRKVNGVWSAFSAPALWALLPTNGETGQEGMIVLRSEWAIGVEYHNDSNSTAPVRYLSVALVRDSAVETGWRAYKCLQTHISSPATAPPNGPYWEEFPLNVASIFTSLILATNAQIVFTSTNDLVIQNQYGQVVAGLTGKGEGSNGWRIWAGGNNPAVAPYRVNELGEFVSTKADIQGRFESNANGGRIVIDPEARAFRMINSQDKEVVNLGFDSDQFTYPVLHLKTATQGESYGVRYSTNGVNAYYGIPDGHIYPFASEYGCLGATIINREKNINFYVWVSGDNLKLNLVGLPTSATGLSSGQVWRNGNVLNIVP